MNIQRPRRLHNIDGDAVLQEAVDRIATANKLSQARRNFLRGSLTLGGLAMLSGCMLDDSEAVNTALTRISRVNDKVQGLLFDPNRLAPTYPDSMITRPFPFNAYYGEDEVREVEEAGYRLEVAGLVADRRKWSLPELRAMPQADQVTRHICVEGWSAIGKWGGVPFFHFLRKVGADTSAKYVGFKCADDYYTSIDMATALHPQTLLALTYDGQVLPPKYGFPMKLRMPTKLGYRNLFTAQTRPRWGAIGMSGPTGRAAWAHAHARAWVAQSPDFTPTRRASPFSGGLRRCGAGP